MYRAIYQEKVSYGLFEQDNLKWQAQWHDENSLNPDKYERGGWYETEEQAIDAAKEGKRMSEFFRSIFK
jgi:hypothetical protein